LKKDANISDNSVTPKKTNFVSEVFDYGKNRFDKTTITTGNYVNSGNGNLYTSASYNASDYIDVSGLSDIILTKMRHIAFYDSNKVFISGREYLEDTIA